VYHERAGIENTEKTLRVALDYTLDHNLRDIVVASTKGYTAQALLRLSGGKGLNVVVVTHNTGFDGKGSQQFPLEMRQRLNERGIRVLTGTMVLRSLGTAIREKTGYSEQDLIANTLRMFCQGIKVCVEIVAMAADAGLIPCSDVISVAGTGRGADTACLVKADSSNRFFDIKIREILIKPKEF
jgi:hypothetical protein